MMHHVFAATIVAAVSFSNSIALADDPPVVDAEVRAVQSEMTAVTLYLGRAAVTRTAHLEIAPGLYALEFTGLPNTLQSDSLQARVTGGSQAKVLGVDFAVREVTAAATPKQAELDARILALQRQLSMVDEQHKINAAQGVLIDSIQVRVGADAGKEAGTPNLDLEALQKQITFIGEQREKLMQRRLDLEKQQLDLLEQLRVVQAERNSLAGSSTQVRLATVTLAAPSASPVDVELTYLVHNATWSPSYNARATSIGQSSNSSNVSIEYDAMLAQQTGEDWNNIKLTLSTAQPTQAANPPTIQPWYVDLYVPPPPSKPGGGGGRGGGGGDMMAPATEDPARIEFPWKRGVDRSEGAEADFYDGLADGAAVSGSGPSVTYELPRRVTVKTNSQQQQKTRIATIEAASKFVHTALPEMTDAVYLRGEMTNSSSYHLLPGPAAIFVDQDFIGPTFMPSVAPKGEFKMHFGVDRAVKATRQLVTKNTARTGLFSGGVRTSYVYRLAIDNNAGKAITVELWDRMPVSRTDRVKIEMEDLSAPLAADAEYIEQEKLQGLLKWMLNVPATASGKNALTVTYTLHVDRAKDVQTTPLPE